MEQLNLLLVCRTNFVVSPIAQAILLRLVQNRGLLDKIVILSAGSFTGKTPRSPDRRAQECAKRNGLDISKHLSQEVTAKEVYTANYVITMDEDSYWYVKKTAAPNVEPDKIKMFLEYSDQLAFHDVPDPVLGQATFDQMFELLEKTAFKLLEQLLKDHPNLIS